MPGIGSIAAVTRLFTPQNQRLVGLIAAGQVHSVAELARMTHRAESNVSRTLSKLAALGVVAMEPGEGRAKVPRLLVRSLRCELDLATGSVRLIDAVRVSAQASAKPARARRAAAPAGSRYRTVAT